jgi:hypothetical protein
MNTKHIGGSILPSSDAMILKPLEGKHGNFQVKPIHGLDTHGLFLTRDGYTSLIAMHPNGYSCHGLAKRIIDVWQASRPAQYAIEQYKYINACGGMTKDDATMQGIIPPEIKSE